MHHHVTCVAGFTPAPDSEWMEQHDWFDGGRPQNLVKASTKLCMTIMQQITATLEHPVPGHREVSRLDEV